MSNKVRLEPEYLVLFAWKRGRTSYENADSVGKSPKKWKQ